MDITNSIEAQEAIVDIYNACKLLASNVTFRIDISPKFNHLHVVFIKSMNEVNDCHIYYYNMDLSRHLNAECLNEFIHNKGLV